MSLALRCGLAIGACFLLAQPALAQNRPPVADAGPDQSIFTNHGVILRGSATDPNNDTIVGWHWAVESAPAESNPGLSDPDQQETVFIADTAGDYLVSLIASDGLEWSEPDFVTIHVADLLPPVAIATADVTSGHAPLIVHFDGSQSYDPQGASLQYRWSFGDQSDDSFDVSPTHVYTAPRCYVASLTVQNSFGQLDLDTISITVQLPASFKLESSVFNAGGHPDHGTILASSNYKMTLDALGEAAVAVVLAGETWRMDASFALRYRPPGEVEGLRFDGASTLRWDPEPSVGVYHLYLNDVCEQPALTETSATVGDPAPGVLDGYLVTAENRLGEEGTAGYRSDESERPNPGPCP